MLFTQQKHRYTHHHFSLLRNCTIVKIIIFSTFHFTSHSKGFCLLQTLQAMFVEEMRFENCETFFKQIILSLKTFDISSVSGRIFILFHSTAFECQQKFYNPFLLLRRKLLYILSSQRKIQREKKEVNKTTNTYFTLIRIEKCLHKGYYNESQRVEITFNSENNKKEILNSCSSRLWEDGVEKSLIN